MTERKATKLQRESEVEEYLVGRVKNAGGHAFKFTSPGTPGAPDRLVVAAGRLHFVELKREGGKLDPAQVRFAAMLAPHGIHVHVLDSRAKVDDFIQAVVPFAY